MKKHLTLAVALLTIVCAAVHAQLPSYLPADGLVGWWPFNGNANDESGNGNHGVVNGAVLTSDKNGVANSAYAFNGSNSYIDISSTNGLSSSQGLTMSVWFNWGGPNSWNGQFIYLIAPNPNGAITINNDGTLYVNVLNCNCASDIAITSPVIISQNTWYHVSLTYDLINGTMKLYLNGDLIQTQTESLTSYYTTNNPGDRFGNYHFNEYYFSGKMDEGVLYNRALTEQEIQNLYTGSIPSACIDLPANLQAGLVGYWPFCGNANDESGNGNNGTVNGATLVEDRFGNAGSAYSFDGVDDNVIVEGVQSLTGFSDLSISLWVNPNALPATDFMALVSKWEIPTSCGNAGEDYGVWLGSSGAIVGGTRVNTQALAMPNVDADLDQWQQVTFIHDHILGSKIYKDGILTDSSQLAGALCSLFNDLVFGAAFDPPSTNAFRKFNGLLDDITIYNRALTPEEVTQLYAIQSTGDPTAGGGGNGGSTSGVPRGISYQAVARDAQGQAIASAPINVRFTLHQGTPIGATEYSETHALTTNAIGLFSTYFGSGTAITAAFDSIVWSNSTKFLQVEIDLGNGYVDMGTQQLMSVPYALRSAESARIKNAALPIYPDNAAALAGGLVAGEMYRTATGDLKVVY